MLVLGIPEHPPSKKHILLPLPYSWPSGLSSFVYCLCILILMFIYSIIYAFSCFHCLFVFVLCCFILILFVCLFMFSFVICYFALGPFQLVIYTGVNRSQNSCSAIPKISQKMKKNVFCSYEWRNQVVQCSLRVLVSKN